MRLKLESRPVIVEAYMLGYTVLHHSKESKIFCVIVLLRSIVTFSHKPKMGRGGQ